MSEKQLRVATIGLIGLALLLMLCTVVCAESPSGSEEGQLAGAPNGLKTHEHAQQAAHAKVSARSVSVTSGRVISVVAVADTTVVEAVPHTNYGGISELWTGYVELGHMPPQRVRTLVRFDLSDVTVPIDTITRAYLRLYHMRSYDWPSEWRTVSTHRVSSPWSEHDTTWETQPSSAEPYGTVGARHGSYGWIELDVSYLVRAWVRGIYQNHGILISSPEIPGEDSSFRGFASLETSNAPQLVIECDLPEPTVAPAPTSTPTPVPEQAWVLDTYGRQEGNQLYWSGQAGFALQTDTEPRFALQDIEAEALTYLRKTALGWYPERVMPVDVSTRFEQVCLGLHGQDTVRLLYWHEHDTSPGGWGLLHLESTEPFEWYTETVDVGIPITRMLGVELAMDLDSEGYPHLGIACSYDGFFYSHRESESWQHDLVSTGGSCDHPSIAIDQGMPHLAHDNSGQLCYAHKGPSGWFTDTVDVLSDLVRSVDLATDQEGLPRAIYSTIQPTALRYATQSNGIWRVSDIVWGFPNIFEAYIAVDDDGQTHIASRVGGTGGTPHYAIYGYLGSRGWKLEALDEGNDSYPLKILGLELDAEGLPHIGYTRSLGLRHDFVHGWRTEAIEPPLTPCHLPLILALPEAS